MLRARASDRSFEHQVNLTAFAIFALRAVGHSPGFAAIHQAAGWIERQQNADGGFSFGYARLAQRRRRHRRGAAGARRCGRSQRARSRRRGGLSDSLPEPRRRLSRSSTAAQSNAQSTAWAIQGLIAAGYDPAAVRRRGSRTPIGYLESLRAPDGSVRYSRTGAQTPVWVTAQALIALAGRTFPVG